MSNSQKLWAYKLIGPEVSNASTTNTWCWVTQQWSTERQASVYVLGEAELAVMQNQNVWKLIGEVFFEIGCQYARSSSR